MYIATGVTLDNMACIMQSSLANSFFIVQSLFFVFIYLHYLAVIGLLLVQVEMIEVYYSQVILILLQFISTAGLPQYGQLGHGTDNEV
jgi:hypothetical protein